MVEHRSPKPGVGGSSPSTPARRGSAANFRTHRASESRRQALDYDSENKDPLVQGSIDGNVSVQVSPGGARGDPQDHVAVAQGNYDHHRHGVRHGGDRLGFLPGLGSNYSDRRYLRSRHWHLKAKER